MEEVKEEIKEEKISVWKTFDKIYTNVACRSSLVTILFKALKLNKTKEELGNAKRQLIVNRCKNAICLDNYKNGVI